MPSARSSSNSPYARFASTSPPASPIVTEPRRPSSFASPLTVPTLMLPCAAVPSSDPSTVADLEVAVRRRSPRGRPSTASTETSPSAALRRVAPRVPVVRDRPHATSAVSREPRGQFDAHVDRLERADDAELARTRHGEGGCPRARPWWPRRRGGRVPCRGWRATPSRPCRCDRCATTSRRPAWRSTARSMDRESGMWTWGVSFREDGRVRPAPGVRGKVDVVERGG